jgi:hypothetical protein
MYVFHVLWSLECKEDDLRAAYKGEFAVQVYQGVGLT